MARPRDPAIDVSVIEACAELLDEVGRANLSRRMVAERAGVSLPAVNRRFRSVDDLILAVAARPRRGRPAPDNADGLRPYLVAVLNDLAGDGTGTGRRAAAELAAAAAGDPRVARALAGAEQAARSAPRQALCEAQQRGSLPADVDVDLLLDELIGTVRYRLLWFGQPMSPAELQRLVARALPLEP